MKKVLILLTVLMFSCFLSGCYLLKRINCQHEFEKYLTIAPTCEKEGSDIERCQLCLLKVKTAIQKLGHELVDEVVEPDCDSEGYTLSSCTRCDFTERTNIVSALGHSFSEWVMKHEPTDLHDGLEERICSKCVLVEKKYHASTSYIDLAVVRQEFNVDTIYKFDCYEDLLLKFKYVVASRATKFKFIPNFEFGIINILLENLVADCDLSFNFKVKATYSANTVTLTFEHENEPTNKTGYNFIQYDSVNYYKTSTTRTATFDEFKINKSLYTFNVQTSNQLFFALERGVKPICEKNSSAEKCYTELKNILRKIVDDNMSDYIKVRAIHDYLIMNVTYDYAALNLLENNVTTDISSYNCFYLEGVLFDKVAVCEGISKAFVVLCNIEGIPCVMVTGKQTGADLNTVGHAWNKVYVDGNWYIVDLTNDGRLFSNFEVLSYQCFMVKEDYYKEKYTGETFKNILCTKELNPYDDNGFKYNFVNYDFIIESKTELGVLIDYFRGLGKGQISVEVFVTFDFGTDIKDEIYDFVNMFQFSGNAVSSDFNDKIIVIFFN